MLELYHWEPNANSAKVMICLREKALDFVSRYVDILEFEQYSQKFLSLNDAGQVPVLVHDGNVLTESAQILEYLVEAFPQPRLAPVDPKGWYDVQSWGKYVDYHLGPSVSTLGWQMVTAPLMKQRDQEKLRQAVEKIPIRERQAAWRAAIGYAYTEEQLADSRRKIMLAIRRIEETLAGSSWLVGQDYTIADIGAFALARALPRLLPEIVNRKETPRTMEWIEKIDARPAVKAALAMRGTASDQDLYAPGPEHSRWG